jgi:hypothetical protein
MMNFDGPSIFSNSRLAVSISDEANIVTERVNCLKSTLVGESITLEQWKNDELRQIFQHHQNIWKDETMFSSSSDDIINNSSYQEIIGYGRDMLPFILLDLKETKSHWFYALQQMTGENPIKTNHRGYISKMVEDWLIWAEKNNIVFDA